MAQRHWPWWAVAVLVVVNSETTVTSNPETYLLAEGCSQYKVANPPEFFNNLNMTMADIRNQISNDSKHFAIAQSNKASDIVYAMFQCRNYLSISDCLSCFNTADFQIRNCSSATGARMIYDGCFLRYEIQNFELEDTRQGNGARCGNQTVTEDSNFNQTLQGLLGDLAVATPRISSFFAATSREVNGGGGSGGKNKTVYAVAQCVETITPDGCRACLTVAFGNIQNCIPNPQGRAIDAGCFLRYSNTSFFPRNQTIDITPFLKQEGSSKKKAIIIGGVAGGVGLFLLLLVTLFLWHRLSRKPKAATQREHIFGSTELQGPVNYSYGDLKAATKKFNEEYKLGEGGFGDVYKGVLKNGNVVAVKKLALGSARARADFNSEVRLISNVHHRNVIRLLGCSGKGPDLLLVYEYVANGSLDDFLFGKREGSLNWKQRYDIIFGMARGLAYLHDQFHVRIIHRDIKSSNILLDDDFQPKIADFGLARLLPEDRSHLSTRFAGTLGYTAPEYAIHGQLSEKVDTYSFGVVVLEIISGRRSNQVQAETSTTEYLLQQAWQLYDSDCHSKLVDESLDPNDYNEEEVKKIIEIALLCTQSPASLRPTMSEIVVMLLSDVTVEQQRRRPNRPAFIDSDNRIVGSDTSTSTGSSATNATVTLTEFTGR